MIRPTLATVAAFALAAVTLTACDHDMTEPLSRAEALHFEEAAMPALAAPVLPATCSHLAVAGATPFLRAFADGVQIYRWNGAAWTFVAPSAPLTADAEGRGVIGSHYAGPTWESNSGSKVVGAVRERCTPDASAVPWLLLDAASTQGPGVFSGVTAIQRVHTAGGLAPASPGAVIGEEVGVPYTTEYLFYRGGSM